MSDVSRVPNRLGKEYGPIHEARDDGNDTNSAEAVKLANRSTFDTSAMFDSALRIEEITYLRNKLYASTLPHIGSLAIDAFKSVRRHYLVHPLILGQADDRVALRDMFSYPRIAMLILVSSEAYQLR